MLETTPKTACEISIMDVIRIDSIGRTEEVDFLVIGTAYSNSMSTFEITGLAIKAGKVLVTDMPRTVSFAYNENVKYVGEMESITYGTPNDEMVTAESCTFDLRS